MSSRRNGALSPALVLKHLSVLVGVSAVLGLLVAGLAIPFAGALGAGAKSADASIRNLPEALAADPLPQRTRVLGRNGQVLATFFDENRTDVKLSQVAPIMRKAIVAIEDYRFYQHGALDLKGTLRAFVTNQANDGVTQGGSSITQQMSKMTLLQQATTAKARKAATTDTYQRKIAELRHAIAFEQNYSKDWILQRYLNIAYFGDGTYGIEAASRHYFSKDASQLDLRESALLAGLVKSPNGYDPTTNPDRARARRNVVLARMAQLKIVPQERADTLQTKRLGLVVTPVTNGCLSSAAPFFCDYVRRYLLADPSLGKTTQDRAQLILTGGLTIKTTLDLRFQKSADQATSSYVDPTDDAIGALAMVQPGTGDVLAVSQSRPMGRDKAKGQTFLNYVVDSKYGDSNGFQGGSTFKLFVLASALEQGLPATTSFNSPQQVHLPQDSFEDCDGPYTSTGLWEPQNSTGVGRFNMYNGTQKSVNTFFAQLEQKTGLCKPYSLARAMGVDLTDPDTERVPSFTLGVADVSPLEMAGAYATVAARGLHCDNRPVTQILNADGSVFKDYTQQCQQVMNPSTADTVNDILRGVMEPGGFGQALTLDKPSAGKTGTINSNMAVWFDGYTPQLATASVIAGADPDGHHVTLNGQVVGGSYIGTAHGSTTAGPMWADAMRGVQDDIPDADFVRPTDSAGQSTALTMPDVTGMTLRQARQQLEAAGLAVSVGSTVHSAKRKGSVAASSPAAGAATFRGSTVSISPSGGR